MNHVLAALIFFTRLPFGKIKPIPAESFKHVVAYWSLTGWLTGWLMFLVFLGANELFSYQTAVVLALIARLVATGALHEDGLADFFDGFGGGRDRESTLRIMKDSHTGSYGMLALLCYYLLAYSLLTSLPPVVTPFVLLSADAWSKSVSSHIINLLPYARTEENSKAGNVYVVMTPYEKLISLGAGLLPLALLPLHYRGGFLLSVLTFFFIYRLLKQRLGGYTGDCCGALFLLCELSAWMGVAISNHLFF